MSGNIRYRIESYSPLTKGYGTLKPVYKTYEEALLKFVEKKGKHRIIKEEFINNFECKVTIVEG